MRFYVYIGLAMEVYFMSNDWLNLANASCLPQSAKLASPRWVYFRGGVGEIREVGKLPYRSELAPSRTI